MLSVRFRKAWRACQFTVQRLLKKYVFTFNALLLLFLTFQSSCFVLLSTYVQQRKSVATGSVKSFIASHFLLCVEFSKLLLSLFWCALDVRRKMREGATLKVPTQADDCEVVVKNSPPLQSPLKEPAQEMEELDWETLLGHGELSITGKSAFTPQLKGDTGDNHVAVYKLQNASNNNHSQYFLKEYLREMSLFQNNFEGFMMLLPAVWYAIQNYFILNALSKLDPMTFQLCYQIRIPLTALVMYISLGTNLNSQRWLAIIILFVGVILGQAGALNSAKRNPEAAPKANEAGVESNSTYERYVMGLVSVFIACTLSSISSVYMEWIFKKRSHRCLLSVRNIHLASFSILYFIILGINECLESRSQPLNDLVDDLDEPQSFVLTFLRSYFTGFDYLVVILVLFHACGGIIVALVMRYSDNIMKSFSIGASILLSGVGSIILFNSQFNCLLLLASILVIMSIFIYNSA